jgi:hypothetical protein
MMPMSGRPSQGDVRTPSLKEYGSLKVDPPFRCELARLLSDARSNSDAAGVALCAFALALSFDLYEPYQFAEARILLDEAISYFTEWPEAVFNRGVVNIHLRQFDNALLDFSSCEQMLLKELPRITDFGPNRGLKEGMDTSLLMLSKLFIFSAEAYVGRGHYQDFDLARANLLRGESYLLKCAEFPSNRPSVQFWLAQIPSRLRTTVRSDKSSSEVIVPNALGFFAGLLTVACLVSGQAYMLIRNERAGAPDSVANATAGNGEVARETREITPRAAAIDTFTPGKDGVSLKVEKQGRK